MTQPAKIEDLIRILQEKDRNTEIEFIVITTGGKLICGDIRHNAKDMMKALEVITGGTDPRR